MDWNLVDILQSEEGDFDGQTYISKTSKFQISIPDANWEPDFAPMDPAVRMRLRPNDPAWRDKIAFVVEIHDYPDSQNAADLNRQLLAMNQQRWTGFKKISGTELRATDPTMPDGVRPGYDLSFTTTQRNQVLRLRVYSLYCRYFKRTYDILMVSREDSMSKNKKAADATAKSFAVLDATGLVEELLRKRREAKTQPKEEGQK